MKGDPVDFDEMGFEEAPSQAAIQGFYEGMRKFWQPVTRSNRVGDGKLVSIILLGMRIVLARLDGKVYALRDICRHMQTRISLGEIVEVNGRQCVQCPYHGWAYGGDGQCTRIPQFPPERPIPPIARIPSYLVVERYGVVWVCLADAPYFDIPEFPEWDDARFRVVALDEDVSTKSSATRMIMGTLDDTHFPWVHEGILGERDHPQPPAHKVWREDGYLVLRYETKQPKNYATTDVSAARADDVAPVEIVYTDYVGMPNVIRLVKETDSGTYVIWLATSPNSYGETTNFWAFARDYDLDPAQDDVYEAFSLQIRQQDKPIIESQRPWLIPPLLSGIEIPLGPADTPLVEYQKWLEELGIVDRM